MALSREYIYYKSKSTDSFVRLDLKIKKPKNIIGISAYYHDSAAALVIDGEIISAVQEERFTRKNMIHPSLRKL